MILKSLSFFVFSSVILNLTLKYVIKEDQKNKLKNLRLSNNEWKLLEALKHVLEPLYKVTNISQGKHYSTISKSFILGQKLIKKFTLMSNSTDSNISSLASILAKSLTQHLVTKISKDQKEMSLVD